METYTQQFNSISQFYQYICDTPFNNAFRWARHGSTEHDYRWTQTHNFEQAVELLRNGWHTMATNLTNKLRVSTNPAPVTKPRNVLSVSGYQPVVPLYLAGVPTNMISKQLVKVKSKVIDVTKLVNYNGGVKADQIVEESIKALQIVNQLERQGYRINLNIAIGSEEGGVQIVCKVRIKNANERLNVSKVAFPLVHPSMLRRLFFRYIEVNPNVTSGFVHGYGTPVAYSKMKDIFPNDIVIPSIFTVDVDKVVDLQQLQARV